MWRRLAAAAARAALSAQASAQSGRARHLAAGLIASSACLAAVAAAESKHAPHAKLAEDGIAGLGSGAVDREEAPIAAAEMREGARAHGVASPPRHAPYVIVGTGTAAFAAVIGIRERDPKAEILVIGRDVFTPYQRPPLSKELWTGPEEDAAALRYLDWQGKRSSIFYELDPARYEGVHFILGSAVASLDADARRLRLEDGSEITYGSCLLATGGTPKGLSDVVDPVAAGEVTTFRKVEDFRRLYRRAQSKGHILVVGGGFLGSELAAGLNHRGKAAGLKVTQVFPEKGVMHRVLPSYLSEYATRKLAAAGVDVRPNVAPTSIDAGEEGKGLRVTMSGPDGPFCEKADHAVLCVGIEPSVALAAQAGLPIDVARGGIAVDGCLRARPGVYAAGDVASYPDRLLGRRRVEHYDQAFGSGKHAGGNMAGAGELYHHQPAFWSSLEGTGVAFEAVGAVDSSLPTVAFWHVAPDGAGQEYRRGVVYYMQGRRPVGVLLWGGAGGGNGVEAARRLLGEAREVDRLEELQGRLPL